METSSILSILRYVFKPISNWFGKLFFREAYEISTAHKMHWDLHYTVPRSLAEMLEYNFIFENYYLRKKLRNPMLWIKSRNKSSYSKAKLTITAFNSKEKYQDNIIIFDIDNTPTQTALPSIPFRNIKVKNNMVYLPYKEVDIRLTELYDNVGNKIELYPDAKERICPIDNIEVARGIEKGDFEKWGEIYNGEFIEELIKEEKRKLFASPYESRPLVKVIKRKMSEYHWVAKVVFWSKNIISAKHIKREYQKYINDYERLIQWEEEAQKEEVI